MQNFRRDKNHKVVINLLSEFKFPYDNREKWKINKGREKKKKIILTDCRIKIMLCRKKSIMLDFLYTYYIRDENPFNFS